MYVGVIGCGHGELDKIYEVIEGLEDQNKIKVDLVVCCGDFQSVRNMTDLRCMACPIKYQRIGDFYRYFSGEKKAPILTLFIGGNHEASNYLQELPYGGWVAPNIYYLGYSSVVRFGHLKIAGVSGIYKGHDYLSGRFECPPYTDNTMRSVYHYRNLDIFRLKQIKEDVDIVLSHDWPRGVYNFGDLHNLLRKKPHFREEISKNELGCNALTELIEKFQPNYWFSAHLHVKFAALINHSANAGADDNVNSTEDKETIQKVTKFLALDKILPGRQFLQIIEFPEKEGEDCSNFKLTYDPEWLAILKSTNELISFKKMPNFMPGNGYNGRSDFSPTAEELREVNEIFKSDFTIPDNFVQTAQPYQEGEYPSKANFILNPQTTEFCEKLRIDDPLRKLISTDSFVLNQTTDDDVLHDASQLDITMNKSSFTEVSLNPDEISLDDEEEDNLENNGKNKSINDSEDVVNRSFRNKLNLPPPKDSTGGDDEEMLSSSSAAGEEGGGGSKDSDLIKSIFETEEAKGYRPEKLEDSGLFFILDKVGEIGDHGSETPEAKKRRNEDLFLQLENEDN